MSFVLTVEMIVDALDMAEVEDFVRKLKENKSVKEISVDSCNVIPAEIDTGTLNLNQNFVIFSRNEWLGTEDSVGFWSNELGWSYCDIATRYTLTDVADYGSRLPVCSGNDAVFMIDPVPFDMYPFAIKVRPVGLDDHLPWVDFVCFAKHVDEAKVKACDAYPGASVYSFIDMKRDMDSAEDHAYCKKDFANDPKKYELFRTARVNVPGDFDCSPFLPGQIVAIMFSHVSKDSEDGTLCPIYSVATSFTDLDETPVRYFANALAEFVL